MANLAGLSTFQSGPKGMVFLSIGLDLARAVARLVLMDWDLVLEAVEDQQH